MGGSIFPEGAPVVPEGADFFSEKKVAPPTDPGSGEQIFFDLWDHGNILSCDFQFVKGNIPAISPIFVASRRPTADTADNFFLVEKKNK